MIHISNDAKAHFLKLLEKKEKGTQIRVFVTNPGTPNAECGISYCPPDAVRINDVALKFGKLIAYIDRYSAPYLKDSEIDLIKNQFESQLILKAPNAKLRKLDDDKNKNTTLFERVEFFLNSKINAQLAIHGGRISLKEITDDGYVILQFSGGCNGCSMASFTLKNSVEKQLLNQFSELRGVYDLTEHHRGEHSYY